MGNRFFFAEWRASETGSPLKTQGPAASQGSGHRGANRQLTGPVLPTIGLQKPSRCPQKVGKQNYLKDGRFIAPHCDPDDREQWDGLPFNLRALEHIPRIGPSPGRN
jgi:hypothetical protein